MTDPARPLTSLHERTDRVRRLRGHARRFNPCGFALLPGYLATFLGPPGTTGYSVRRALVFAAAVTTGFVAVFGTVGIAVSALSLTLDPWLSVVTLVAGLLLLVMGVLQLTGRDLAFRVPRTRLLVDGSASGMVAYGVIYASVSLSCTLPVFLAAVVSAFSAPGATPSTGVLAYAAGMGLVMATLAVVVGLLGRSALARTRAWTRLVGRVSGVIVLAAALYALWYSWVELASYRGTQVAAGPVAWISGVSASVSQGIVDAGTWQTMLALCVILAAAVTTAFVARRRR